MTGGGSKSSIFNGPEKSVLDLTCRLFSKVDIHKAPKELTLHLPDSSGLQFKFEGVCWTDDSVYLEHEPSNSKEDKNYLAIWRFDDTSKLVQFGGIV